MATKKHMVESDPENFAVVKRERSLLRSLLVGAIGLLVGAVCIWVVLRWVELDDVGAVLAAADAGWLALGLIAFWMGIAIRVVRWRRLLRHVSSIRLRETAEALIVGYAMNYLLPARLGEPFRAEYAQRRFQIDRFTAFGSIVTERVIDGLTVVLFLLVGLILVSIWPAGANLSIFHYVAAVGLFLFGGMAAALYAMRGIHAERIPGPLWLGQALRRFLDGAAAPTSRDLVSLVLYSGLIWALESLALWSILRSLGLSIAVDQLLVVVGSTSLSALVPTAPGYVGSFQLVFAMVLSVFSLPTAVGVAAATLVQALFYLSLVAVAFLILIPRWLIWLTRKGGKDRHGRVGTS
jgi:uncharacterized protein (TIRG00374 family)